VSVWELFSFLVRWVPVSAVLGGIAMFLIRPKLTIKIDKARCRELVAIRDTSIPVMVLRLFVENLGWRQVEAVAFVEEIYLNNKIVEPERSLLNKWADTETDREILGHRHHKYINLCMVREDNPSVLFIRTAKGDAGYHFDKPGLYMFTVSVGGRGLHSGQRATVEVLHDKTVQGLKFLSIDGRTDEFKLGEFVFNRIGD
jgi:hypothetical protein